MSFILKAQNKSEGTEQAPSALNLILTDCRYAGISFYRNLLDNIQ